MLATALIASLQAMVEVYGDLPVYCESESTPRCVDARSAGIYMSAADWDTPEEPCMVVVGSWPKD